MLHNIPLGNTTKSRRTKDVDVEPAASSNTPGKGGTSSCDDGSDQVGDDSDSEVEISDSEAEAELEELGAGPGPRSNRDSKNKISNSNSSSNTDSNAVK